MHASNTHPNLLFKVQKTLAYLGLLPFLFTAAMRLLGQYQLPYLGDTNLILTSYALIIITFMAAIHWGQASHLMDKADVKQGSSRQNQALALVVLSNVITLIAWFAYLWVINLRQLLIIDIVLFVAILAIDWLLRRQQFLRVEYFRFRVRVTVVVIICLITAIASIGTA